MTRATRRLAPAALAWLAASACWAREPAPEACLRERLVERRTRPAAIQALRATGDANAAPILRAALASDGKHRPAALDALHRLLGADATGDLVRLIGEESDPALRAQALAMLLADETIKPDRLAALLDDPDEKVRTLAAKGLVAAGRGAIARKALTELTGSGNPSTVAIARLNLLACGETSQLDPLREMIREIRTPPPAVGFLLRQIEEMELADAKPLALLAARKRINMELRALAWRTAAAVHEQPAALLAGAVQEVDSPLLAIPLLRDLADRDGSLAYLRHFAKADGLAGAVARFEVARATDEGLDDALGSLLKTPHPLVVDYVLSRSGEDVADDEQRRHGANRASAYVGHLAGLVAASDRSARRGGVKLDLAIRAARVLAEMATPEAHAVLRRYLAEDRRDPPTRAASSGLLRCTHPSVAALARPMLASRHDEFVVNAALTLAGLDDPASREALRGILARHRQYPASLDCLAAWYLLRLDGQAPAAARRIARRIESSR